MRKSGVTVASVLSNLELLGKLFFFIWIFQISSISAMANRNPHIVSNTLRRVLF
jgi:hypothetical protein